LLGVAVGVMGDVCFFAVSRAGYALLVPSGKQAAYTASHKKT